MHKLISKKEIKLIRAVNSTPTDILFRAASNRWGKIEIVFSFFLTASKKHRSHIFQLLKILR